MRCSSMESLLLWFGVEWSCPSPVVGSASGYREKELAKVTIKKEDLELIVSKGRKLSWCQHIPGAAGAWNHSGKRPWHRGAQRGVPR